MSDEVKDQTDKDFKDFWTATGYALAKQIAYAHFIAGVESGLAQCQKIIKGDDESGN